MKKNKKANASTARTRHRGALVAAAFALPGLAATTGAVAQGAAPQEGIAGFKVLQYNDYQPSGKRMEVQAASAYVAKTVPGDVVISGGFVLDSISGASPLYHSTLSGASGRGIRDIRRATDLRATKYFDRWAIGGTIGYSKENDYRSLATGIDFRWFSASKNTVLTFGYGNADDAINSTNGVAVDRTKRTDEAIFGITQVLTKNDIVQSNVTVSSGRGYYNDPYKSIDFRPDHRRTFAWLTRWNHYFDRYDATSRTSVRWYRDTFGITSVTLTGEWVQPLRDKWTVVPSLRYYSQGAADFYFDPPFPSGFTGSNLYSADQRLSAFGAYTGGLKVIKELPDGWIVDAKAEYYEQRGSWRLSGSGSPGLEPFRAQIYQLGVAKRF